MNALRSIAERDGWSHVTSFEDNHAAVLVAPDTGFLYLQWYKRRGRTEQAFLVDEFPGPHRPLTLTAALSIIKHYEMQSKSKVKQINHDRLCYYCKQPLGFNEEYTVILKAIKPPGCANRYVTIGVAHDDCHDKATQQ